MKRVFLMLLAAAAAATVIAAESVTQAKSITPTPIPTAKEMKAMFEGLRPEALSMGMGDAVLIGATSYETMPDQSTRVTVNWHSIGVTTGAAAEPLKSPLYSQFRINDKTVPPASVFSVRGDLDALASDYQALKAKMQKASPRDVVKQTNNNNTETTAAKNAADALQPSGGRSSGAVGGAPFSMNNNDSMKTDLITTQWQACVPRIDRTGGKVYAQARKIEVTESGRVMSTGDCQDYGTVADVVREYDKTCTPVVDVENRKVFHQFREFAKLDGKEVEVSLCTADFNKFDPIKTDTAGCGFRHDFVAGRSIPQEKLYYNEPSGNIVSVRGCGDSNKAFTHYTTTATCTPTIDTPNKQVFINIRTAFKDDGGAELYANDCRPDGNPAFAIAEEFCTPKFEHDFVNNASYYSTRPYYVNGSGSVVYLASCSRSAQASFAHQESTTGCQARNDDANLKTYFSKKKTITTPDDGTIEVQPCTESQVAQSYVYTGNVSDPLTLLKYDPFYTYESIRTKLPGVDWTNPSNTFTVKSNVCNEGALYAAGGLFAYSPLFTGGIDTAFMAYFQNSSLATGINLNSVMAWNGGFWHQRTNKRYMRGDGTSYDVFSHAAYELRVGCKDPYNAPFGWK